MTKTLLVTGGNGMLSYEIFRVFSPDWRVVLLSRTDCDVTSFESCMIALSRYEADAVINTAAYTAVDRAEEDESLINFEVNALGTANIARAASVFALPLVHISSDYVFDGEQTEGYEPEDICNPINAYGMAKYLGEQLCRREHSEAIIVRTSWLYGGKFSQESGENVYKNFVNTISRLSSNRSTISVVDDQYGLPTYAYDLSRAIRSVIEDYESFSGATLHFTNSGESSGVSWYLFSREILSLAGNMTCTITPCDSSQYPTSARRPRKSVLINTTQVTLPHWRDALERYMLS